MVDLSKVDHGPVAKGLPVTRTGAMKICQSNWEHVQTSPGLTFEGRPTIQRRKDFEQRAVVTATIPFWGAGPAFRYVSGEFRCSFLEGEPTQFGVTVNY